MNVAHVHTDEGICAERWLGALVHAGVAPKVLEGPIERAGIPAELVLDESRIREVTACWVRFETGPRVPRVEGIGELHATIERAGLPPRATERAHEVAAVLGRAEAAVHDMPVDQVRLHELGRPIVAARIVAGAAALEELDVDRVTVGPVAVGQGTIRIAHGRFPVPAPAVQELLRGFVIEGGVEGGDEPSELTTPSGAAVLAALAEPVTTTPRMRLASFGRGATRRGGHERMLTVLVGSLR